MGAGAFRVVLVSVVGAVLFASGCVPPNPTPGPVPSCPNRTEVPLEAPHPVAFSLPRALSPDGGWWVGSRYDDGELILSVAPTNAYSAPVTVGVIPDVSWSTPSVAVSDDGSHVLFGQRGGGGHPDSVVPPLHLWERASGTTEAVQRPSVSEPPEGVVYPTGMVRISESTTRVAWSQSVRVGYLTWRRFLMVTDAASGEVLHEREITSSSDLVDMSSSGRFLTLTDPGLIVDVDAGTEFSTAAEELEIAAQIGGGGYQPLMTSDDGNFSLFVGGSTVVRWDRASGVASVVLEAPRSTHDLVGIDDDGNVAYTKAGDAGRSVRISEPSGTDRVIDTGVLFGLSTSDQLPFALASANLHTISYSKLSVLGNALVAQRCS